MSFPTRIANGQVPDADEVMRWFDKAFFFETGTEDDRLALSLDYNVIFLTTDTGQWYIAKKSGSWKPLP